jgi:hypothetical protein
MFVFEPILPLAFSLESLEPPEPPPGLFGSRRRDLGSDM